MPHTLDALATVLNKLGMPCTVDGRADRLVDHVATLEDAGERDISFLSNSKYVDLLKATRAGAVIVSKAQAVPDGMTVLRVADPYAALTALLIHIYGYAKHPGRGIDTRAVIDPSATIGEGANIRHGVTIEAEVVVGRNVTIYPGCHVGANCRLGDDCILYPNVVVYHGSVLGHRVTLHAGTVIGEDGLGYAPYQSKWLKIPQVGTVEIGDDVEIGANCTVDRATLGKTVIASGTKFSNLIAIGHGTKIGQHCMFVAQVGLAGSVTVGDHVRVGGKVGVAGHLTIGDKAEVAAMAGVMEDVPPGTRVMGAPAFNMSEAMRSFALFRKLPEMREQLRRLEAQVAELKKTPAR